MNNFIEYFYGMRISRIIHNEKYYSFIYNNFVYRLYPLDNSIDVNSLYEVNKKLLYNTLMSEIIINKDGFIISSYNNISYILIKLFVNSDKTITLDEIAFLSNFSYKTKNDYINWGNLWSKKIDYLEDLIHENGKKYPLIVDSFNYFVGMAENAISYFNKIKLNFDYKITISHKIIKYSDCIDVIYNPLNIIFDYRVRDVAEYIKNAFFTNNAKIFKELYDYLKQYNLSLTETKLLISRLLYPSFYFEMYEDILIDNKEEKIILDIINKSEEYEDYLKTVIDFFKSIYDIEEIEWLKKRRH